VVHIHTRLRALLAATLLCALLATPAAPAVAKHGHPHHHAKKSKRVKHRRKPARHKASTSHPSGASGQPAPATAPAGGSPAGSSDGTTAPSDSALSGPTPPADTPISGAPSPGRLFSPASFWNAPLPDDAALDPLSGVYVSELQAQLKLSPPWINYNRYSTPVYTVPAGQATVHVTLDKTGSGDLQAVFNAVPIPQGATPAAGNDATLTIWQPDTDTLWEFWRAALRADGWHAAYGGRMTNVSQSPGYFDGAQSRWGATATSLPFIGGLMRISELKAGHFDHALAISIPEVRANVYSWPAQRTDGTVADPNAIPEGTRFRLDPSLDLTKLRLPPLVFEMAQAVRRYGLVVRDRGAGVTFYGEDPTPLGIDPYGVVGGFFGRQYPDKLLAQFPWSHLQALKTTLAVDSY